MTELNKFLLGKEGEVVGELQNLLSSVNNKIQEKNKKITQLLKDNEEVNKNCQNEVSKYKNILDENTKLRQEIQKVSGQFAMENSSPMVVKNKLKFLKIDNRILLKKLENKNLRQLIKMIMKYKQRIKDEIANYKNSVIFDNEKANVVDKNDLEAFKIVINDLEQKKKAIQNYLQIIKEKEDNEKQLLLSLEEKDKLLNLSNIEKENLKLNVKEYKNVIEEQRIRLDKYVNIESEYLNLKNEKNNLNVELKNKNDVFTLQQSTIDRLKVELENKNVKIVELKNDFFALVGEFNKILERVKP